MNLFLDVIIYGLLFLFVWATSFLMHEFCHILGSGTLHGTITINGLSMNSTPANLLSGGIGAGIVFSLAGAFIWIVATHALGYLFVICGAVNLCYGPFEACFLPRWGNDRRYKAGRYGIYIVTTIIMLLFWVVFLR
jgi:hypothetical protein